MKLVATMKPVNCALNVSVGTISAALVIATALNIYFTDAAFTDFEEQRDPITILIGSSELTTIKC